MLGKIDEYDGSKEEWPQYIERLNHFFVANGIIGADKKSAFLAGVGPATYALARNLVAPDKPAYDELVALLMTHFNPTTSETVQRFKFHSRFNKSGESCNICFRVTFPCKVLQFRCNARGYVER